tara:strand:- start:5007 stop:6653 length:1647 start_codon:yes stop_codon:yes gene_type:complete
MVDEEQQEGVDVDALDKTLEKLTKSFEKLNKNLEDFTKTAKTGTTSSKVDHDKIHKQNMERQRSYFENVEAMKRLSQELKGGTNSMKMFTGLITKGATAGLVFQKLTGSIEGYITQNEKYKDAHAELQELIKKYGSIGDDQGKGKDERWSKASDKERARGAELREQTKGKSGDKLADQLGGAKEFFSRHKMGMMIGAGSAGILLKVLKMAFDASPMFQQIQKLLKFGIMMVLRPIGDFFGFIMRPIMIMLLRKFIIPWYTKMYPQMMKWGTEIGTKLAGALGALADGDVGGAFAALWGDVDWGDLVWKVLKLVITPIAIGDLIFGVMGEGDNSGFNAMGQAIKKWYEEGIASITPQWNEYWTDVKKWFGDGLDSITAQWNTIFYSILGWLGVGLTKVTSSWNSMFDKVKDWIGDGLKGITNNWSDMFWVVYHWLKNGLAGIGTSFMNLGGLITGAIENAANLDLNGNGTIGMADGGQINEHILGIGKSGQIYEFGERGSETVTPNSGGGSGGITINIQNMSASQQDLNNLRQTILDVVQEANSRRGRI